jgi:hypothetical protein
MMGDIEKIKKEIECFTIQDLAEIIRLEPLISEKTSILGYNKKQREELKSCMLEIAKKTLDLAELEEKFLEENNNKMEKKIFVTNEEDKAELKELMKKHLDRETYNILKELF